MQRRERGIDEKGNAGDGVALLMGDDNMETEKIRVKSDGSGMEQALDATEKFAHGIGLSRKESLRLRLLAEETLAMVRAIVAGFDAEFRLEGDRDRGARIHLVAYTVMDYAKKKALIDASTSKKNAAVIGVMGKIRELFENGIYRFEEIENLRTEYGGTPVMYGAMGIVGGSFLAYGNNCQWSLQEYRKNVEEAMEEGSTASEAWDELEKSIVVKLADDVRVAVSGDKVEMVIEKTV